MNETSPKKRVAVIGAGPAGLTAAYRLLQRGGNGVEVTVLESDPNHVGGIAKTIEHDGFRFDIGGHRFFSKSKEVEDLWTKILPDDMLTRKRSSRILYGGKFFSYPLKPTEALARLGPAESVRCLLSYARARIFPSKTRDNFEDWVSDRFGRRLYSIFFKTYTEKVWGMDCREISADWAEQRIGNLSMLGALTHAVFGRRDIKSLVETFRYPRLGPGMMWDAFAREVERMGGSILMGRRAAKCSWDGTRKSWTVEHVDAAGGSGTLEAEHLISSAPLAELLPSISPQPPKEIIDAARALKYRDFILVALIVKDRGKFDDNWIYVHDPAVKVGRIQNFKSWSPEMSPEGGYTCYGLEYFCFGGDGLWTMPDSELIELARTEIDATGLANGADVARGYVVRQRKAYPVYDRDYAKNVEIVRDYIDTELPTLHVAGRNGMHKYNNQDHAMMTAIMCADNILAGEKIYDQWRVNHDACYLEDGNGDQASAASGLRAVPVAPADK